MRFSSLVATTLVLLLTSVSQGADRTLIPVPYHSQIGEGNPLLPNNWCTVACINMVFDYYEEVPGPPFCQPEIAMVVNTDDVGGGFAWFGTRSDDARRGCHFSILSASRNGGFHGYSWRTSGFSAVDTTWHWAVSDLKDILDLGYPIIIHSRPGPLDSLYREDGSPFAESTDTTETGHSRVLVGYDDTLSPPVFIMHDPWSPGPDSIGAFIWCSQSYFLATVWPPPSGFLFVAPWDISISHPDTFDMNDTVRVRAKVSYTCPDPFTGLFPLVSARATAELVVPTAVSFAVGDSSLHDLPGVSVGGDVDSTEWLVVVGDSAFSDSFMLRAGGVVSSFSYSYPFGYNDSLGGSLVSQVTVADLSPPSVNLVYPDGGEVITGGVVDTVRWSASDNVGVDTISILLTTDAGVSWDTLASGEPNDSVSACLFPEVDSDSCKVIVLAFDYWANAGSDTSDSFFSIQATGVSETAGIASHSPPLLGLEPNPFHKETTIRYSSGRERGFVLLRIHDSSGRVVRSFDPNPTRGQVIWDGRDDRGRLVPSGVYFCRMITKEDTESRSLVLIR